jgi:hypothetical protein
VHHASGRPGRRCRNRPCPPGFCRGGTGPPARRRKAASGAAGPCRPWRRRRAGPRPRACGRVRAGRGNWRRKRRRRFRPTSLHRDARRGWPRKPGVVHAGLVKGRTGAAGVIDDGPFRVGDAEAEDAAGAQDAEALGKDAARVGGVADIVVFEVVEVLEEMFREDPAAGGGLEGQAFAQVEGDVAAGVDVDVEVSFFDLVAGAEVYFFRAAPPVAADVYSSLFITEPDGGFEEEGLEGEVDVPVANGPRGGFDAFLERGVHVWGWTYPRSGAAGQPPRWARRDLNPHSLRNQNLNLARLPISPLARCWRALLYNPAKVWTGGSALAPNRHVPKCNLGTRVARRGKAQDVGARAARRSRTAWARLTGLTAQSAASMAARTRCSCMMWRLRL